MEKEKYQPTAEEKRKAEEMMLPTEKKMSEEKSAVYAKIRDILSDLSEDDFRQVISSYEYYDGVGSRPGPWSRYTVGSSSIKVKGHRLSFEDDGKVLVDGYQVYPGRSGKLPKTEQFLKKYGHLGSLIRELRNYKAGQGWSASNIEEELRESKLTPEELEREHQERELRYKKDKEIRAKEDAERDKESEEYWRPSREAIEKAVEDLV